MCVPACDGFLFLSSVSCAEAQCSEHLQIKDEVMQKGSDHMGEQSQEPRAQDSMFVITYVDSCIGDISESSKRYSLFTPSTQAMEAQRDCGVSGTLAPAWETLHDTGSSAVTEDGSCSKTEESKETQTLYSSSNTLNAKRKQCVKRSSPHMTLNKKRARQITNQNSTLSYSCKACGKIFHYMYTLRTHAQTHTKDKSRVCGICGKHLQSTESLVQHLQSHTKSNKCGTCGKQFSSNSRLKRHRMFHRPKGVNVMSSA
uniref:C2H2-type domain-containing protein n=1 Tax=Amphilophus citrinellus TaxID=61819 RepID=A0A3Q0SXV2_AMPCI